MFAAIYQGYVKPGRESEYQQLWSRIACYFVEQRGAIGSTLHQAEDGRWVAYSRWPDKETRDASWPGDAEPSKALPPDICQAIVSIKDCFDATRPLPEICMTIVDEVVPF